MLVPEPIHAIHLARYLDLDGVTYFWYASHWNYLVRFTRSDSCEGAIAAYKIAFPEDNLPFVVHYGHEFYY